MEDIKQKTKQFISQGATEEAITGLIKLQLEAPQKQKHIPRRACLSLMQINHDWQGIRKLLVEWKLQIKFGKDLVSRMRMRVNEDAGKPIQDAGEIVIQLDRLNEKNWRQFSPKRNGVDYYEIVKSLEYKPAKSLNLEEMVKQKEQKKEGGSGDLKRLSTLEGESIFSKITQGRSHDKNLILKGGIFSKQALNQAEQEKPEQPKYERPSILIRPKDPNDSRKAENSNSSNNSSTNSKKIQKQITPSKEKPLKIISLKYANEKDKIQEEASKDEFSFSAPRQKQLQGLSNSKKKIREDKQEQIDNSFLNFVNFTNDSRSKELSPDKKSSNLPFLKELEQNQKQDRKSIFFAQNKKSLFTDQELNLIEPHIPFKNHINKIIQSEGKCGRKQIFKRLRVM